MNSRLEKIGQRQEQEVYNPNGENKKITVEVIGTASNPKDLGALPNGFDPLKGFPREVVGVDAKPKATRKKKAATKTSKPKSNQAPSEAADSKE